MAFAVTFPTGSKTTGYQLPLQSRMGQLQNRRTAAASLSFFGAGGWDKEIGAGGKCNSPCRSQELVTLVAPALSGTGHRRPQHANSCVARLQAPKLCSVMAIQPRIHEPPGMSHDKSPPPPQHLG